MSPAAVAELLECYGVPQVRGRLERDAARRGRRCRRAGWPVALKALAPGLLHKTRRRRSCARARQPHEVRAPRERIRASVSAAGFELDGFLVQPMIDGGVELLVGMVHDESFGPVLACGAGGTNAELLQGRRGADHAGDRCRCREMLRALRCFRC